MKKWIFWLKITKLAREALSLDYSSEEFENHLRAAKRLFEGERIIPNVKNVLIRFSELEDLEEINISTKIMDGLKECIYDYVCDRFISSIALAGILSEYIVIDQLINKSNKSVETAMKLRQIDRLNLLKDEEIINFEIFGKLSQIRKIRNKYIHPSNKKLNKEKDAFLVVIRTVDIANKLYRITKKER